MIILAASQLLENEYFESSLENKHCSKWIGFV